MTSITVEDLKKRLDSGEKINLIDVREPAEYQEYNLGGELIPLGKIASMMLEDLEDRKNDELIIHCKMGGRSMQACQILEMAGFTNVVNVTGGAMAYRQLG